MRLIWPEFERQVRALRQVELDQSPELLRECKQQRRTENTAFGRIARRLVLPIFWNALFLSLASKQPNLELAAGVVSLWAAGTALRWGHQWFQQFYASDELAVLNSLPLDDGQIFRFQLRGYCRGAIWIFWEFLLAYAVVGLIAEAKGSFLLMLGAAAVVQSLLVMALALHAANFLHMLPLGAMGAILRTSAAFLLITGAQGAEISGWIVRGSEWFLPTGWVTYILLNSSRDAWIFVLLVPISAVIYLARFSFERLRGFYSLEGLEILPASGSPAGTDDETLTDSSFSRPGPTEMEDRITAGSFLQGVNWENAGIVEKAIARLLTPREKVITEFLVAQNPGWTRSLNISFWVWLAVCLVVLAFGQFGGTIVFFAAYILGTVSLPVFGGDWRGMRQNATGGVFLPGYALYPICFNAMARIFFKVNLVRICAASPFILSFAALAAYKLKLPPVEGAMVAGKLLGILLAVQPLMALFPISSPTNETAHLRLPWALLVTAPIIVILFGAATWVFIATTVWGVIGSFVVLGAISIAVLLLYRSRYRRGKFDLLTRRSQV